MRMRNAAGRESRVISGIQEELVITSAPAGAEATIGKLLRGTALTIAGDYICAVDAHGLVDVEVHLKATIGASTATSAIYNTFADETTEKTGFTGDGALASTVLQSSTLAGTKGAGHVIVKITLGAAPTVTFTVAEINGL